MLGMWIKKIFFKSLQVHTLLTSIISTSCISLLSAQTLHMFTNIKTRLCLIHMAVYTHCPSHGWVLLTKKTKHCRHKVKAKFGGGGQKLWPHSNLKQNSSAQCVGIIGRALKPQLKVMLHYVTCYIYIFSWRSLLIVSKFPSKSLK